MKLIICFFTFAFCIFAFSCQGDEGQPVDYGPAVAQSDVDTALNNPAFIPDPLKIQLGQFVDVIQSQIIDGEAYSNTGEIGTTVVGRDESDTQITYTILQKVVSFSDNKTVATELIRTADKNSATEPVASPAPVASAALKNSSLLVLLKKYLKVMDAAPTTANPPTTFHNLKVSTTTMPAPDEVKAQDNCGGIANCTINIQKVAFDMLVWNNPTTPDKIHREFSLSADVPFFANVMSECDSLLVPAGTIKTLVTLCSDVANFKFTTPQ